MPKKKPHALPKKRPATGSSSEREISRLLALLQQSQEREENTQQELQQSQERERLLSEQLKAERAQTANNAIMHTLNSLAVGPQSSITAATFHERYDDALTNSPFEAMIRGAIIDVI